MKRVRLTLAILCAAAGMTALSGCGGPPDVSGIWEGDVEVPDVGKGSLTLDLKQDSEGKLSGSISVLDAGASPDEAATLPVERGSVGDDGTFQAHSSERYGANISGEVSGDAMDADFSLGNGAIPYKAERITEEEASRRNEERQREAEEAADKQQEEQQDQDSLHKRFTSLDAELNDGVDDVERRFSVLFDAADNGPAAQLSAALGPKNPDEDFACSSGGVSCEVEDFAGLLESDQGDFADEDDYSPDNCDIATDRSYYEEFDLAKTDSGSDYVGRHKDIVKATEGLGETAEGLIEQSREVEKAADAYEKASGYDAGEYYVPKDIEVYAGEAQEVETVTLDDLAAVEERYSEYESRIEETREAALALHDSEGC